MKKAEEIKLKQQLGIENHRGETFVGYRPATFVSKKNNKKMLRNESKKLCSQY